MGRILLLLTFLSGYTRLPALAQHTYYLSPHGSDLNPGLSPRYPWKTIGKIDRTLFLPGDRILLQGGAVFRGTLILHQADSGLPRHPLVIGSFGKGRAIIDGGDGDAIYAYNFSGLHITGLVLMGNGIRANRGSGIDCYDEDTVSQISQILIDHCESYGFRNYGIVFRTADGADVRGFRSVRIEDCAAHDNGLAGIASFSGWQRGYVNRDFRVTGCRAFHNPGIRSMKGIHTGDGIVMGSVDSLLIAHCEAYDNGSSNACNLGGPVGIWVWLCRHAVIQYCRSFDNHTGSIKDGGGFDIDGGSSDCVLQYNISRDNDGAGYLLAEYGAVLPYRNNLVRFNISLDDGRKNNYGGITIWGAAAGYRVTDSYIYNNLILVSPPAGKLDTPSAVRLMGNDFRGVMIEDNIFQTSPGAILVNSDTRVDTGRIRFVYNDYFQYARGACIRWGNQSCLDIMSWIAAAHGQERVPGKSTGVSLDPRIAWKDKSHPVSGRFRIPLSTRHPLSRLGARPVLPDRLLPAAAVDFYGNRIGKGKHYFIGISIR